MISFLTLPFLTETVGSTRSLCFTLLQLSPVSRCSLWPSSLRFNVAEFIKSYFDVDWMSLNWGFNRGRSTMLTYIRVGAADMKKPDIWLNSPVLLKWHLKWKLKVIKDVFNCHALGWLRSSFFKSFVDPEWTITTQWCFHIRTLCWAFWRLGTFALPTTLMMKLQCLKSSLCKTVQFLKSSTKFLLITVLCYGIPLQQHREHLFLPPPALSCLTHCCPVPSCVYVYMYESSQGDVFNSRTTAHTFPASSCIAAREIVTSLPASW